MYGLLPQFFSSLIVGYVNSISSRTCGYVENYKTTAALACIWAQPAWVVQPSASSQFEPVEKSRKRLLSF
jgi:hypothetical protein